MSTIELRAAVAQAHADLAEAGLAALAFGNVSAFDRATGVMAIKPSGISAARVTADQIVLVDVLSGAVVKSDRRPSSDTPTHLELYRQFAGLGGIVHTHSAHATAWAQAGRELPCLGTTHADHFRGPVPVSRPLSSDEMGDDYEAATGRAIVERFGQDLDPADVPAILVHGHGPFVWGRDVHEAIVNAIALEMCATIATHQAALGTAEPIADALRDRHFLRKHGPTAYYGQGVDGRPIGSNR